MICLKAWDLEGSPETPCTFSHHASTQNATLRFTECIKPTLKFVSLISKNISNFQKPRNELTKSESLLSKCLNAFSHFGVDPVTPWSWTDPDDQVNWQKKVCAQKTKPSGEKRVVEVPSRATVSLKIYKALSDYTKHISPKAHLAFNITSQNYQISATMLWQNVSCPFKFNLFKFVFNPIDFCDIPI